MIDDADPPRLIDDPASGLLREALRGAREDVPEAGRVEAMLTRFPPIPGGPPGSPPAPPPAPSAPLPPIAGGASATSALGKIAFGLVVAGALGGAAYVGLRGPDASAPNVPSTVVTSAVVEAPTVVVASASAPTVAPSAEASASSAAPVLAPKPAPSSSSLSPSASSSPDASEGPSEIELLRDAQAALSTSPGRALSLTDEHAQRFPRGSLGQERDMIRIQALLALGRADEARALADDFRRRHPGSAHNARLDELFPPR